MENRTASWYSIVRYTADNLTGETVNVGVIMHLFEGNGDSLLKYLLVNENSPKIKAITQSQEEERLYKTFKDNLEYYLYESTNDLLGNVGEINIGSPSDNKFLDMLFDFHENKKMFITRPKFSLTNNAEGLFNSLFKTYIGIKYLDTEEGQVSTKRYVRKLLEDRDLLNKKVIGDHVITPIKELKNIEIKIDFCFKNGVWNYMQGIPAITGPSQNTEWFTKTKFMIDNISKDSKVQFLYRDQLTNKNELDSMISYFSDNGVNVKKINVDDKEEIDILFSQIENDAHDIEELMIS